MMIVYDVTVIYKNGSSMVLDNCVKFDITIGGSSPSVELKQLPCAKTRMLIMNVGEIMAAYKHCRRIWNPFKIYDTYKMIKEK